MTTRFLRLAVIGALLTGMGAHLAVLQSYAWATMAWRAARGGSLRGALTQTFDGRHPCAVCAIVKKAAAGPSLRASAPARTDMISPSSLSAAAPSPARFAAPARAFLLAGFLPPPSAPPPKTFPA